jgi:hypothetical protein
MKTMGRLLAPLVADKRVGPVHVCLWLAIWQCAERHAGISQKTCARWRVDGWMVIRREELMRLAKMEGKTTYYRVMGDLARWGYVQYTPSRRKGGWSRVKIS